jgi:hypothetical protein
LPEDARKALKKGVARAIHALKVGPGKRRVFEKMPKVNGLNTLVFSAVWKAGYRVCVVVFRSIPICMLLRGEYIVISPARVSLCGSKIDWFNSLSNSEI